MLSLRDRRLLSQAGSKQKNMFLMCQAVKSEKSKAGDESGEAFAPQLGTCTHRHRATAERHRDNRPTLINEDRLPCPFPPQPTHTSPYHHNEAFQHYQRRPSLGQRIGA